MIGSTPARAAPLGRMVLAQARVEVALTLRRGESLLVALGFPLGLLLFFGSVDVVETGYSDPLDFLVPGAVAIAVISTAMVSLGIATGFERRALALKRLGGTPLPPAGLLAAKGVAALGVEAMQIPAVFALGIALGWDPAGSLPAGIAVAVVGTATFAALGLLMAGTLRADATLAVTNAVYVFLLLVGGLVVPLERLPGALESVGRWLPASALSDTLRGALGSGGIPAGRFAILAAWGITAAVLAGVTFRWEEAG